MKAENPGLVCFDWTKGDERLTAVVNTTAEPVESGLCGLTAGVYTDLVEGGCYTAGEAIRLAPGACALLKKTAK